MIVLLQNMVMHLPPHTHSTMPASAPISLS
nr:MAG TPA: hypothetical protein [Caudoviricetes sp.]